VIDTGATAALAGTHASEQTTTALGRTAAINDRAGASAAVLGTHTSEQTTATAAIVVAATAVAGGSTSTTTAALTSVSLVVGAEQSDADNREKHRDTKNNNSIHPRLLHRINLQVP
jgi:hypothetical protein